MRGRIVFLLEEPSMKALLDGLLPRLFPAWQPGEQFLCVPHQGKSDLDRSVPVKLRAWQHPDDRFVIVRDNDNADCIDVKGRFRALCLDNHRPDTLIRLVCQELESWYLGDLKALAAAFGNPKLDSAANRKRFAAPDSWQKPSVEVQRLAPVFQKIAGARAMASHLGNPNNRSSSFRVFVTGVAGIAAAMGYAPPAS
ncbi:MAG: DUF4276 family protein [Burkholderiaceae bacterium]|jgi:hypothetical protein